MLSTAEARWFQPGEIPASVLAWFEGEPFPLEIEEPRTDHYLAIRDTDSLGVKLRQGRLEAKQRSYRHGLITFTSNVVGNVEVWRKWGFALAEVAADGAGVAADGAEAAAETAVGEDLSAWIAVRKQRRVRSYMLRPDCTVVALPGSVILRQGCSLELSRVSVGPEIWWSLCLEAVGKPATLVETLRTVGRYALASAHSLQLDADASYGYPRWLQVLQTRPAP